MTEGFVLDQQVRQGNRGLEYRFWLSTDAGPLLYRVEAQEALFFYPRSERARVAGLLEGVAGWRVEGVALLSFDDAPVDALYASRLESYYQARDRLSEARIPLFEEDIRPCERFLMERHIRGGLQLEASPTDGAITLANSRARGCDYRPRLRLLSIDIETAMTGLELYSIGLQGEGFECVLMRGAGEASDTLRFFDSERALLNAFVEAVQHYDPDLLIGWNVVNFDLDFLVRKAEQLRLPLRLGRGGETLRLRPGAGNQQFAVVPGRAVVDGIDCLKGATYHFESYALDAVAQALLGRGKLIEGAAHRGEEIGRLFREDPARLAAYNLEDCRLVTEIFRHARLVEYLIERACLTGLSLDRVGGSAAAFDNLYLPRLHREGYVAPEYASGARGLDSPGGYVMDSRPGLYDRVLVLDFKSLYPSIIRTFLIDPLGLLLADQAAASDRVEGFNGGRFHRDRHILPQLLAELWAARDRAKAEGNLPLSRAIKIIMNACYGVLGSPLCRFFDQRLSGSITLRGHQILNESRDRIESQGYTVIYGDTDSLFVWVDPAVFGEAVDTAALGARLAADLNRWWQRRLADEQRLDSRLEIEFETCYRRFLMPTIRGTEKGSKKRYCGLVRDAEGNERLVFKGLETVRSDWTPLARRFQQELFERIFHDRPYRAYIEETVARLMAGTLDAELVYRKRLRQPLKDYVKTQPPHVQAARIANRAAEAEGRRPRYRRGGAVSYYITVNGPEPAELRRSAIDYGHYLEKQLAPVADTLLPFVGDSFSAITEPQLGLF